jgi:ribosomal protein L6P/L9E
MLSIVRKIIETKTPKEITITIYKPNKENQIIIVKGKLGQYKIKWKTKGEKKGKKNNSEWQQEEHNEERGALLKGKAFTGQPNAPIGHREEPNKGAQYEVYTEEQKGKEEEGKKGQEKYGNIGQITTLGGSKTKKKHKIYKKEKKNFIYEESKKKIKDKMHLIKEEDEKKIEYYTYIKGTIKEYQKMGSSIEKINIGQVITKENEEKQTEQYTQEMSKSFKEEVMEAIKGITQGYTISLELKGIGYQAKIKEEKKEEKINKNGNKNNEIRTNQKTKEQKLEKNMKKISSRNNKKENWPIPLWGAKKKKGTIINYREGQKMKDIKRKLIINVGLSHNVEYELSSKEIKIKMTRSEDAIIKLIGIAKKSVSQVAAEIYKIKKPEPYKGKGIRYNGKKYIEKKAQRSTKKKA